MTDWCLFCGAVEGRAILNRTSPRHVICPKCGLVFQSPQPTQQQLEAHYAEKYWQCRVNAVGYVGDTSRAASITEWISPHVRRRDLVVEYGCGGGFNLRVIRQAIGCEVFGVEPSAQEIERAVADGIPATVGVIGTPPPRRAKIALLCHVLEHLPDPIAELRQCADALADDGLLAVEVPSVFHLSHRRAQHNWLVMEHLWYFSQHTLARVFSAAGFTTLRNELVPTGIRVLAQPGEGARVEPRNESAALRRMLFAHRQLNRAYRLGRRLHLTR